MGEKYVKKAGKTKEKKRKKKEKPLLVCYSGDWPNLQNMFKTG